MARMRIGDMLVKAGLIDEMQLNAALGQQRQWGGKLGDILVDRGILDEQMLWLGLSRQLGVALVSLPTLTPQPDVLPLIPVEMCERLEIFPISRDDRTITIATSDPNNVGALDEVAFRVGLKVKTVLAPSREVTWAQRYYFRGDRSPCPPPRQRRVATNEGATPAPFTPQPTLTNAAAPPLTMSQAQQMPWQGASHPPSMAMPVQSMTGTWQAPTQHSAAQHAAAQHSAAQHAAAQHSAAQHAAAQHAAAQHAAAQHSAAQHAAGQHSAEEQLRQANEMLSALIELCIQRGVFTREELWHRLAGPRS